MKTQNIIIAHPQTVEQVNVMKAFMEALNIKFEIPTTEEKPYNPEFVAKIEKSRQQAKEGKTVSIDLDDIWKD